MRDTTVAASKPFRVVKGWTWSDEAVDVE